MRAVGCGYVGGVLRGGVWHAFPGGGHRVPVCLFCTFSRSLPLCSETCMFGWRGRKDRGRGRREGDAQCTFAKARASNGKSEKARANATARKEWK